VLELVSAGMDALDIYIITIIIINNNNNDNKNNNNNNNIYIESKNLQRFLMYIYIYSSAYSRARNLYMIPLISD